MAITDINLGEQGQEAFGRQSLVEQEPRWVDWQNVAGLQQEVLDNVDEVAKCAARLRPHYAAAIEGHVTDLGDAITKCDLVAVTLPHRFTTHTNAYKGLLKDFKFEDREVDGELAHVLLFPAANITAMDAKAYQASSESVLYKPALNVRIQTSSDVLTTIMGPGGVHTEPSIGNWYQFPLHDTSLAGFTQI